MKEIEIPPGCWALLLSSGFRAQFCPRELLGALMSSTCNRGGLIEDVLGKEEAWLDRPGMVAVDRSHETLEVLGLRLTMAVENFEYFFRELEKAQPQYFGDRQYFRIEGWLHALVITPDYRLKLLALMRERLPRVQRQAATEEAELERRLRVLEKKGVLTRSQQLPLSGRPSNDYKN